MSGTVWSLLPAVVAIGLALATRQVIVSLLGGILTGAVLLSEGFWAAFPRGADLIVEVAADKDKLKVVTFTLLMGALVGVIAASGGTKGVVSAVSRVATTRKRGQLATFLMGLVVFFDDYASTLLVGSTMRPITDKLRISREKLSYIVDSTSAPIASLALVSTWIGYEVSVLGDAMTAAGIVGEGFDAYGVFVAGLPSRFYPLFAIAFVAIVSLTGRDFGPMWRAERRALTTGAVLREGGRPLLDASLLEDKDKLDAQTPRASLAVVPVVLLVATILLVLFLRGTDASYDALLYGAWVSLLAAVAMALACRALTLQTAMDACVHGFRAMALAIVVLVLAWSIGKVMGDLKAGEYVATLVRGNVPTWALPTITFVLAGLMALATGTSWGTMAILFPILLPVLAEHRADPAFLSILLGSTSSVLAGAVFGDHCSPISDTTVLSSISSAADHVDHTKTQAPYALLVAGVSIAFGTLPLGFGVSPFLLLPLGGAALIGAARFLGRPVAEEVSC